MLNRKLTEADVGKDFSCNYFGTTRVVKLLQVDVDNLGIPYCFGSTVLHIWTNEQGVSVSAPMKIVISEIEKPEEFKLNQEVQAMEIETTFIKLNKLYLRNDGKVIHTIKEHPKYYKDNDGIDRSSDLTMEGSDGYFYSHKDGRAYTQGTSYETFLVAEVTCDPFTTLEDLDNAQEKLVFVKPW